LAVWDIAPLHDERAGLGVLDGAQLRAGEEAVEALADGELALHGVGFTPSICWAGNMISRYRLLRELLSVLPASPAGRLKLILASAAWTAAAKETNSASGRHSAQQHEQGLVQRHGVREGYTTDALTGFIL